MGGSGKGKASKGSKSAAGGARSATEPIDLSIETQPRHFTYVGKIVNENGAPVLPEGELAKGGGKTRGKDGGKTPSKDGGKLPSEDASKGGTKGAGAASVTNGTGKAAGKAGGKSPGKDAGKSPGKDGGKSPGKDGGKTPGKDGGKSPGKDGGKTPGEDGGKTPGKGGGKTPGKDAGKSPGKDCGKSLGKDGGKTPGKDSGKSPGKDGGKSPGKDAGKSPGKDDGTNPGKAGGKSPGKDGGKSPGKAGGKIPGKDGGKTPGKDGGKTLGKDACTTKGSHIEGAKGGKKGIGKTKSPEASEPGSGKGRGPSTDPDPHTPPPRIGSTAGLPSPNTGTPPSNTAKGKKGKGKTQAVSKEGAAKLGCDGQDHAVCRRVSFDEASLATSSPSAGPSITTKPARPILRMDTGLSTSSDGTGPIEMAPLNIPDGARPLTDEEREQIQALSGPADIPLQQRKALNEKLRRRMMNGQGLRKGLVAQWAATPPGSMARFEFLKAFLLDRDLASIVVSPCYEELSESKEKEVFEELPLCIIKERYDKVEGGKKFIAELLQSQGPGKKHPQSDDENMRLYKLFKANTLSSANINRVGNKTKASMDASANKAERAAIAETIQGKVAGMHKSAMTAAPKKGDGKNKRKKELTPEEISKKSFDKDLQSVRDLVDKAVSVAAGLGKCGLENQESLITQLGHIATNAGWIRDEIQKMIFASTPFEECEGRMLYYKEHELKDYQRQVLDAEGILIGQERRKAAEKRKREKAEEERKKKQQEAAGQEDPDEYAETGEEDAEMEGQEEWPEDAEAENPAPAAKRHRS